jgi:hypothetical protein
MKLFEIKNAGETYIVAAKTMIQALKHFCSEELSIDNLDDDSEIRDIPNDEWSKIKIRNTEYDPNDPDDMQETFTLEELVVGVTIPWIVSSTTYE